MTGKFLSLTAASFVVLLFTTTPFIAHHSEAAQFDTTKPVKVSGVVKKVAWMNPHIWFYIDVKDEKGNVTTWGFTGLPAGMAIRNVFTTDTLKVDQPAVLQRLRTEDGPTNECGNNIP